MLRSVRDDRFPDHPLEEELGFVAIVLGTSKLDVVYRGLAAGRIGPDVMELQQGARGAAAAPSRHEGATVAVSSHHRTPDLGRDVTGAGRDRTARPRAVGGRELLAGQILEQQGERPIEDLGGVSGGHGVAEEVLRLPQLVPRRALQR